MHGSRFKRSVHVVGDKVRVCRFVNKGIDLGKMSFLGGELALPTEKVKKSIIDGAED